MRKREEESFILFRRSLNNAIDEYKNNNRAFTERTAKELYSDVIGPQMTKLDARISSAKKDLIKTTSRKGISWLGAISFGLYSGLISSDLAVAAASLGLIKTGAEALETIMTKSDNQELVRNDDMYFLWRVRELSKKRQKRFIK